MKLWAISCVAASALACAISAADAMGGGGGGGGYGGMQGGGSMSGPSEYTIAVRLIKHDKCADAVPHLFAALGENPKNADTLNYLGYCERKLSNYPVSLNYYNQALAIDPNHKGVHEYLGELYLAMNEPDKANAELTTLATLCPSGCDERDTLQKAIAAYQPAAATASTPATAPVSQQ